MESEVRPRDELFELFVFLVSSARGAPEEGRYTASLRLIDAAGRLAGLQEVGRTDEFIARLGDYVRSEAASKYMDSAESYVAFLDEILRTTSREVLKRNGVAAREPGLSEHDPGSDVS